MAKDALPSLASGETVDGTVSVTMPATLSTGGYAIEVHAFMPKPDAPEYSIDNNTAQSTTGLLVIP
jgi:hypothetical protein